MIQEEQEFHCIYCGGDHYSDHCPKLDQKIIEDQILFNT